MALKRTSGVSDLCVEGLYEATLLTQVDAVKADEPVRRWDNLGDHRYLRKSPSASMSHIFINRPCYGCHQQRHWWRCCRRPGQLAEQGLRRGTYGCLTTGQEPGQISAGSCLDEDFNWMNILSGWRFCLNENLVLMKILTSELPVSTNWRTPSSTRAPRENREKESWCEYPGTTF